MTEIITLREYEDLFLSRSELTEDEGELIYDRYRKKIDVEFPSPRTGGRWKLRSLGWVGTIPLGPGRRLLLEPKVPIGNLFRMLEYAYRLKSFELLEGSVECQSLNDVYQRLAGVLARRVLDRGRRGYYRAYVPQTERLTMVRGTLDVAQSIRAPWRVGLHCRYQEHTADVRENQLIAWTLYLIARQGICSGATLETVRAAYRSLHGGVTLRPFVAADCVNGHYSRLNDDYRPLHFLCRFFLEHSGPAHEAGGREMLPFLVNMGRLYELFVSEWLRQHLPGQYSLSAQESVVIDTSVGVGVNIDLVLNDGATGETIAVLDTKYKKETVPSQSDINQAVTYAVVKNCRRTALIYPVPPGSPVDMFFPSNSLHLRALVFGLDGDLTENGTQFLADLEAWFGQRDAAEMEDGHGAASVAGIGRS